MYYSIYHVKIVTEENSYRVNIAAKEITDIFEILKTIKGTPHIVHRLPHVPEKNLPLFHCINQESICAR